LLPLTLTLSLRARELSFSPGEKVGMRECEE
jgi:hypothetical protein